MASDTRRVIVTQETSFEPRTIAITGAAGNMGRKLTQHWRGRYQLKLIDRRADEENDILVADLSQWGPWVDWLQGTDVLVHLAADPRADRDWPELLGPNVDALIHVYLAAARSGVRRVIFASSNHVMGGYQDQTEVTLSEETPPRPGLRYVIDGKPRCSSAYAAAKLFGERLGCALAASAGLETVAVRFGWIWREGPNLPENLPSERGEWFRLMWLSDRDFLHLMDCCVTAQLPKPFLIVNGVSANTGMAWDMQAGRSIGYQPKDDITRHLSPWLPSSAAATLGETTRYRWVDLSLPLRSGMRGFDWKPSSTDAHAPFQARILTVYSHCGTHIDAAYHFMPEAETIDQVALGRCCGPAYVARMEVRPGELISVQHLGLLAERLPPQAILLLATGWSRHADDEAIYRQQLPRVSEDLAQWCVARRVKLLGVEPPSVADVSNVEELTRIHRILLGGGVTIVEGLSQLDLLPPYGSWFLAFPLKISGGDGSPCRAAALVPDVSSSY
jgi:kynurenine formamidase